MNLSRALRLTVLWAFRIVLYPFMAWLGLWVIFPLAGGGLFGVLLSAPTAALAIGLDVLASSRLRRVSVSQVTTERILLLDRALSKPGESITDRDRDQLQAPQTYEAELEEPEDNRYLPPGSS